jgi:hypothetical protein
MKMPGIINVIAALRTDEAPDPASLERLQDLVVRPPVPWWPPALGWYALGAILLGLVVYGMVRAVRRWRANAYRRVALAELQRLVVHPGNGSSAADTLAETAELLKRVALAAFPRTDIASLTGEGWISWLHHTGRSAVFPGEIARLLAETIYRPTAANTVPPEQLQALRDATRQWIQRH